MKKIVKDNFRDEKDRVLEKGSKYYILMNGSTIEVAERAVNRIKAKLSFISRNLRCIRDTKRIQAAAYIFGTSRIPERFEFKYVDLSPFMNFFNKETHIVQSGFKEYLKCSVSRKTENHSDTASINL